MSHSIHLRLHDNQYSEEKIEMWFDQFVEEYEDVERGRDRVEKSVDPAIAISGATLAVASIQTLIQIYSVLKDKPEVHYINLYGPDSEKYPVQIYSEALGSIENPGQYDFYEVDNEITLVVCDNKDQVKKVQSDVAPDGLVDDLDGSASNSVLEGSEQESRKE